MSKAKTTSLIAIILLLCLAPARGQVRRDASFHERYTLEQVVVFSRHNIRAPLSGPGSAVAKVTPHRWHEWSSAPGELSLRGGALETMMGQFFRKWLVSESFMAENEIPGDGEFRFYSNSMQRTIATARYFAAGMLPVAPVTVEHHYRVGTMDPVFNPRITKVDEEFRQKAAKEIADLFGDGSMEGIGAKIADNLKLMEKVLDMRKSPAAQRGDTCSFRTDDTAVKFELYREPAMTGGLKLACSVSDAFVLQYYEAQDERTAAFGHRLSEDDWKRISGVKDWYEDVLFTAPLVAVNVAHPLLLEILHELRDKGRRFSFLCGHDSNICSVLSALGCKGYTLEGAIESKTPIGGKIVIEKWLGTDGQEYAAVNLVYQDVGQLRSLSLLSLQDPPKVIPLHFESLSENGDGLFRLRDLEELFEEKIRLYDSLP